MSMVLLMTLGSAAESVREVWLVAALPLLLGIPAITMRDNEPVLLWMLAMPVTYGTGLGAVAR